MYRNLRDLRYQKGDLTQQEMADKIGLSLSGYAMLENGQRSGSRETWIKIQKTFNLKDEEVWNLQKNLKK